MRVFHNLVFENVLGWGPGAGNGAMMWFSNTDLNELLGSVDQLHIGGYVAQVTGTSSTTPAVQVMVQTSQDNVTWYDRSNPAVDVAAPLGSTEVLFQGLDLDPDTQPKLRFARLRVTLIGNPTSTPLSGRIRVWVTGRDFSRRASSRGQAAAGQPAPLAPQTMMR
jgi:hypothetical protein